MTDKNKIEDKRPVKKIENINLFRLKFPGDISRNDLLWYYFVLQAIKGDKIARELLDVSGVVVYDLDGNVIYPVVK